MSKEKQIEEMASILCKQYHNGKCNVYGKCEDNCSFREDYKLLYNAGYRKQKEGEWKKVYDKAPRYVCTICNHLFNNKEYKYCPNCGAKMKGEEKKEARKKHFSPEDVRKMSPSEVKANYQAILESMKKWE